MGKKYCPYCMNEIFDDICSHCGKEQKSYKSLPHHLSNGTILNGKYIVGAVLGEGGFGITYIGRDVNLDIKIAVKEYYPSGIVNRNNTYSSEITVTAEDEKEQFEKGKSNFLSEARTLAKFSDEPNIVSVRDFFSDNNTAYIVMEYLEGINLKDYLTQHGKMSFSETVAMLSPIMASLAEIHKTGLIHRDISPANIMILKNKTAKLLDFGAAREVDASNEKSLSIMLKPGFAPEEQYRTKGKQGPWTDVYAISATMYKMLTGITPIDAMNRIFSDDIEKISIYNTAVTEHQEDVIMKGMAVNGSERYQTVAELKSACLDALGNSAYEMCDEKTVVSDVLEEKTVNSISSKSASNKVVTNIPVQKTAEIKNDVGITKPETCVKKPSRATFAGSLFFGFLTWYFTLDAAISIIHKQSPLMSVILAVAFGSVTFLFGKQYFPRINHKERKPNIFCLVCSILTSLFSAICLLATMLSESEKSSTGFILTLFSLVFPLFFGYFYVPRLPRKKKNRFYKICGGIGAAFVAAFIINVVFIGIGTVKIGDKNFKRSETNVVLTLDTITDNELQKLKELKNLENLEINASFLDDNSIKIIGELSSLKRLTIKGNTDVTDISPLYALKGLVSLDISHTKVSDISSIDKLILLESLDISNTEIENLSVIKKLENLNTLKMNSIKNLDVFTITLPNELETLECNSNGLNSLEFISGTKSILNLYASNNNIIDLTPIKQYQLATIDLSHNKISDLSGIRVDYISTLNLSYNDISDISPLNGMKANNVELNNNRISDISIFKENTKLHSLQINNNQINDISPLKDCFKLYSLNISHNSISDITAVATIDDLEIFNARDNKISDITPLASCKKLIASGTTIELRNNNITNITALSNYKNTQSIYLSDNKIADISPLRYCKNAEMLLLNNNNITDVSPLGDLTKLHILQVVNNPINDFKISLSPGAISGKASLSISYSDNIDFAQMAKNQTLTVAIYGTNARQQEQLRKIGFIYFPDPDKLDAEIGENQEGQNG